MSGMVIALTLTFVAMTTLAGCEGPVQRPQVIIQQPARKAVPARPVKEPEIDRRLDDHRLRAIQDDVRELRDQLKTLDSLHEKEYAR